MPRVPDNTISDVAAAKVTRRNAFSISPSAFPSMGGPLAQAAKAMDTAIALEGRRGKREADLELQRGRDNRNRHLQHARDWEAAMGAAAKATDQWNRVMEHRADDEATRRLTEAERAMTAGTMGQLSPTGDPTGGAFNTPYVPGDPEGNQPGQGASSETGKLAAKVREAAYDGASGRVRYRLDRKFDGVVEPYLRKAQQIDFASAKKLELDTRMSDAAAAEDRAVALNSGLYTAHCVVADQAEWVENKVTTLNLGASVADAARKQAVAAMLKAGYRPINNDFDNPQYAGDAQKMYAQMAKDAGEALSVRIVQSHAQAMVDEETDANAEARKGMCEFIAEGLEEAGNAEAAAQARKIVKTATAARENRQERERQTVRGDVRDACSLIASGGFDNDEDKEKTKGALDALIDQKFKDENERRILHKAIEDAENRHTKSDFAGRFRDAIQKGGDAEKLAAEFREEAKRVTDRDTRVEMLDWLDGQLAPLGRMKSAEWKAQHEGLMNRLEAMCKWGFTFDPALNNGQGDWRAVSFTDREEMLAGLERDKVIDADEYGRLLKMNAARQAKDQKGPSFMERDPETTKAFFNHIDQSLGGLLGKWMTVGDKGLMPSQESDFQSADKDANGNLSLLSNYAADCLNMLLAKRVEGGVPLEEIEAEAKRVFESPLGQKVKKGADLTAILQARRSLMRSIAVQEMRRSLNVDERDGLDRREKGILGIGE